MRRIFGRIIIIMGILMEFAAVYLVDYYTAVQPKSPQPGFGQVLPLNNHGTIVFLSERESGALWALRIGGLVLIACGGFLEASGLKRKKPN